MASALITHQSASNCAHCDEHSSHSSKQGTLSLEAARHAKDGHVCRNSGCDISAPHGHTIVGEKHYAQKQTDHHEHTHEHGHKHGASCSHKHNHHEHEQVKQGHHDNNHDHNHAHNHHDKHDHKHGASCSHEHHKHEDHKASHHHHHDHQSKLWPLEDYIAHSKMPQWMKEVSMNLSFLTPAFLSSSVLEKLPLPKFLKAWTSITAMHGLNRGKEKLPRLGLSYLVSGAASLGEKSPLGAKLTRFFASAAIAVIEKFSGSEHVHHPESMPEKLTREIKALATNITSKKHWKEFFPSLLNIETKVQLLMPLVNKITENSILKTPMKILMSSLSFVGFDQFYNKVLKSVAKDTEFAVSASASCGCCASPVCTAAATDAAITQAV